MIFCHPWNIPDNFCYRNFLTWWNLILTPPGPQGSEGDPKWIFVTLETYLTTFVSETFWFDEIWFWHPQGPPIAPAAPRGQGVTPNAFLSSLKHTWQLLLATFFDLMKFEFEPLRGSPECPRTVGWLAWQATKNYAVCKGLKSKIQMILTIVLWDRTNTVLRSCLNRPLVSELLTRNSLLKIFY